MGCCIPRKPIITISFANKKTTTQIKTAKHEKVNDREIKDLNKSIVSMELKKYYYLSPGNDFKINSSTNTEFLIPFQKQLNENNNTNSNHKRNAKQIKESLKKLKELSCLEVNNCSKFFVKSNNS